MNDRFVLYWTNQIPGLYCATNVDARAKNFPDEMVAKCPEGAGGGNVRFFTCTPEGRLQDCLLGYWGKATLLRELAEHDRAHPSEKRETQANLLKRSHEYARSHAGEDIAVTLRRIEEEAYTLGKVG